jgi:hypothetical protein
LRRQRFDSRSANALFDAMVDVTYARSGEALLSLRHFAPLTAARIGELLEKADDAELDCAVRTYTAYVAGVVFPYTGRFAVRADVDGQRVA